MAYDFLADPILAGAYRYWQTKRGTRPMPRRLDIDPSELVPLLPHLQLTEIVDGGARVRYRLVGTAIVATFGIELTGKYFDEAFSGAQLRSHEENYHILCREKRPLLVSRHYVSRTGIELLSHRLIMPLSADDENVNQALTAMNFESASKPAPRNSDWLGEQAHFDVLDSERTIIR